MEQKLLLDMKMYIEEMEEKVEYERGIGRELDYLLAYEKMPELYYKIIEAIKENNEQA